MNPNFDGGTYEPQFDEHRLRSQLLRVTKLMADGEWRTLSEISHTTGDPPASISARLRDLRKIKFGGHTVKRRRLGLPEKGLFEYQLILRGESDGRIPPPSNAEDIFGKDFAAVLDRQMDVRR